VQAHLTEPSEGQAARVASLDPAPPQQPQQAKDQAEAQSHPPPPTPQSQGQSQGEQPPLPEAEEAVAVSDPDVLSDSVSPLPSDTVSPLPTPAVQSAAPGDTETVKQVTQAEYDLSTSHSVSQGELQSAIASGAVPAALFSSSKAQPSPKTPAVCARRQRHFPPHTWYTHHAEVSSIWCVCVHTHYMHVATLYLLRLHCRRGC